MKKKNDSKALLNWNRRPYLESASTKKNMRTRNLSATTQATYYIKLANDGAEKKASKKKNQQHQPNDNIKRILVRNKFIGV